jgi:uncharacterized protein (TIGR02145 family)
MRKIITKAIALLIAFSTVTLAQQKGTFTDARDKKTYKTVKIGEQVWMAENLNYDANGSKCGSVALTGLSTLSDDNTSTCDTYGRLYNWSTAMAGSASSTENPSGCQGVCPAGWHLPSNAEWNVLMQLVNPNCIGNSTCAGAGTKLKATSGWDTRSGYIAGTDDFGFSALPGGFGGNFFLNVGGSGYWWSASENGRDRANYRGMSYGSEDAIYTSNGKSNLYSVRCVKN